MGSEWSETTLDQLGRIVTGKTPSTKVSENFGDEYPFISPRDLDGSRYIVATERYLSHEGASSVKNAVIPAESVLVSCIGSDLGKAAITTSESVTNQQINSIIVDSKNDYRFVYYNLSARKDEIRSLAGGSAQPILNKSDFGRLPISIPELSTQRSITHILGTLDDKIELNRQINATLEAMAQALFKSWFVDFDPVIDNALAAGNSIPPELQARAEKRALQARAEKRAALGDNRKPLPPEIQQLFPNRFTFTEEMGWVPEGWHIQSFGEMIEKTIGGDWGKEEPDEKHQQLVSIIRGTDIPTVKSGATGSIPTRWVEIKKFGTRELCDGDIVIEVSGGSPKQPTGRAVYITEANIEMLGGSCVPASFCRKLHPKSKALGFYAAQHLDRIYALGKMWNYQNQSTGISNFQTNTFLETECVVLPNTNELLEAFFKMARPMIDKGRSSENENLAKLRDTLLPKLLSGQLRIPEAEQQVAEVL